MIRITDQARNGKVLELTLVANNVARAGSKARGVKLGLTAMSLPFTTLSLCALNLVIRAKFHDSAAKLTKGN